MFIHGVFYSKKHFFTNEYLTKVTIVHRNTREKLIVNKQHDNKSTI